MSLLEEIQQRSEIHILSYKIWLKIDSWHLAQSNQSASSEHAFLHCRLSCKGEPLSKFSM